MFINYIKPVSARLYLWMYSGLFLPSLSSKSPRNWCWSFAVVSTGTTTSQITDTFLYAMLSERFIIKGIVQVNIRRRWLRNLNKGKWRFLWCEWRLNDSPRLGIMFW